VRHAPSTTSIRRPGRIPRCSARLDGSLDQDVLGATGFGAARWMRRTGPAHAPSQLRYFAYGDRSSPPSAGPWPAGVVSRSAGAFHSGQLLEVTSARGEQGVNRATELRHPAAHSKFTIYHRLTETKAIRPRSPARDCFEAYVCSPRAGPAPTLGRSRHMPLPAFLGAARFNFPLCALGSSFPSKHGDHQCLPELRSDEFR